MKPGSPPAPTKNVTCLCGADDYTLLYPSTTAGAPPSVEEYTGTTSIYDTHHEIVKCNRCGLVYQNPRDADIRGLYSQVEDKAYLGSWDERARTFRKHIGLLEKLTPGRDLLDIGCYAGIFIEEAGKRGFNATGVEPSRWAARHAQGRTGARVFEGVCGEVDLPAAAFDVVTLWDVIEHLEDPAGCLSFAFDRLRPGGIAAVTTHDIGSLLARLMGGRYPWLMRFHLYHFTPKTLGAAMARAGFSELATRYYSKLFSIDYLLGRSGLKPGIPFLKNILVPIRTGDMFMVVGRKPRA